MLLWGLLPWFISRVGVEILRQGALWAVNRRRIVELASYAGDGSDLAGQILQLRSKIWPDLLEFVLPLISNVCRTLEGQCLSLETEQEQATTWAGRMFLFSAELGRHCSQKPPWSYWCRWPVLHTNWQILYRRRFHAPAKEALRAGP